MSYGNPQWRPWVLDEAAAQPFFKYALDHGINFFDTADMYSLGVSQEVTGRALRSMAKLDEIVIATKVFWPMNDRPNMGGLSRKHIVQACEASLKRLGIETIDLYQIHRLDPATPIEETLGALDLLVQQGKVRYIGASSAPAWKIMRALGISDRRGWPRFVSMQNHYNLLQREEEREMIPLCLRGIGRDSMVAARARPADASARADQGGHGSIDERSGRRSTLRADRLGGRGRGRNDREGAWRPDGANRTRVASVQARPSRRQSSVRPRCGTSRMQSARSTSR